MLEAIVNVYVHKTSNGDPLGWYEAAAKRVPLGKKFLCPASRSSKNITNNMSNLEVVPNAPEDPLAPRYYWNLNQDKIYDFNNDTHLVGEDGSPYGVYKGNHSIVYSGDTPMEQGKSMLNNSGRICLLDEVKFYDRVVKPEDLNK